jgi:hypothetical protein
VGAFAFADSTACSTRGDPFLIHRICEGAVPHIPEQLFTVEDAKHGLVGIDDVVQHLVFHSISRHPEGDFQAIRSKIQLAYAGERAH